MATQPDKVPDRGPSPPAAVDVAALEAANARLTAANAALERQVVELARTEAAALSARTRSTEILEGISDAFYGLDLDGRFTYANPRALLLWNKQSHEILGFRPDEVFPEIGRTEVYAALMAVLETRQPVHLETFSLTMKIWVSMTVYPSATGLSVCLRDITERRLSEERQTQLMAELQHRVRNTLAVVRSVANRTLETSRDLDEFATHFNGRLSALGRTQATLARAGDSAIDLEDLVREELLACATDEGDKALISGPPISLDQKSAETFALALHELATNAVKYGALSTSAGRVHVSWRNLDTLAGSRLELEWRESGVPALDSAPAHKGFGRELIERGLPYELGAATSLEFGPGGVRCVIAVPIAASALPLFDLGRPDLA